MLCHCGPLTCSGCVMNPEENTTILFCVVAHILFWLIKKDKLRKPFELNLIFGFNLVLFIHFI